MLEKWEAPSTLPGNLSLDMVLLIWVLGGPITLEISMFLIQKNWF